VKRLIIIASIVLLGTCGINTLKTSAGEPEALVRTTVGRYVTIGELISENIDIICLYPDGRADLAVTTAQLDWLRSRVPLAYVLERASLKAPVALDENLGQYHTYAETESMLDSLASEYPSLTRIDTLGTSIEGRLIRAIKISDNPDVDDGEAEVLIMGCHHARELMSVEVPLLLAEYLLDNYGNNQEITGLVDDRQIWIAPMINPDGHVYVQNNHGGNWWTWWRKNRRDNGDGSYGADPNRNYGYMWGYDNTGSSPDPSSDVYRGTGPFSEPETQAVRDFCTEHEFSVGLSYHSYSELIIFPWGYSPLYTEDHELFLTLADTLQKGNGYTRGNVAMGTIYPTNGDTDDWAYGEDTEKNRFLCYTVELNSYQEGGFAPPESLIIPTFQKVLPLNLALIRRADQPASVLGPAPPVLDEVALSPTPTFKLTWSDTGSTTSNLPVAYRIVEYLGLVGVTDHCEAGGDTLWEGDGFTFSESRRWEGSSSYYSGSGNNLGNTLTMKAFYPIALGDTLECRIWYDIESDWDYGYLEVSTDQGLIWKTVPGNITTDSNPNGNNRGNGITGSSSGWVAAEFYLDQVDGVVEGSTLKIRFSYITDSYIDNEGFYLDLIDPVASYQEMIVLTESCTDNFYYREPEQTGEFAYVVSAFDAEGHYSRNSNVVFHTVDDLTGAGTPSAVSRLSQNFPNPFNPSTTIKFTVGREDCACSGETPVKLGIFDVSGRRIVTLRNEDLPTGSYRVRWNGRDIRGNRVASGVYLVRLRVGHKQFSRKIVLLR
jgi:carboxypeptidase T